MQKIFYVKYHFKITDYTDSRNKLTAELTHSTVEFSQNLEREAASLLALRTLRRVWFSCNEMHTTQG